MYTEAEAKEAREDGVDLLEEGRLLALNQCAIYQQGLRRYHNRKVKPRSFQEGDLVLRLIQRTVGQHKLSAPWEGPFVVSKALGNDSYYLSTRKNQEHARETTRQGVGATMEREPPEKILQLKAVCTMLPFLLKVRQTGSLRSTRGLPSFIYE